MKKPHLIIGEPLTEKQILWLEKRIGPRTHHLQKSVGGKGWLAQRYDRDWILQIAEEEYLTLFAMEWFTK